MYVRVIIIIILRVPVVCICLHFFFSNPLVATSSNNNRNAILASFYFRSSIAFVFISAILFLSPRKYIHTVFDYRCEQFNYNIPIVDNLKVLLAHFSVPTYNCNTYVRTRKWLYNILLAIDLHYCYTNNNYTTNSSRE